MVKVTFINSDGEATESDAAEGTSLLEAGQAVGMPLEGTCEGQMACSTCHVVVDEEWFDKVGEPSEAEQDMLDLAYSPRTTSRLGCQIVLKKELDGLVIKLPKGSNNLMDHVPFED